jgi:hypothetical protein
VASTFWVPDSKSAATVRATVNVIDFISIDYSEPELRTQDVWELPDCGRVGTPDPEP